MSLRLIVTFILVVLLTTYFTFLNPGDIEVSLTQDRRSEEHTSELQSQ